jgi:hypothetical protein
MYHFPRSAAARDARAARPNGISVCHAHAPARPALSLFRCSCCGLVFEARHGFPWRCCYCGSQTATFTPWSPEETAGVP